MSSLVGVQPKSWRNPYAIYDGPRVGDAFLEWNMGEIVWKKPPQDLDVLYGLGRLHDMGQIDKLFGVATNLFGDQVESIEFRSQVTPTIVVNKPFAPAGQQPPPEVTGGTPFSKVVLDKVAKPAAYIRLKGGLVYSIEPYGRPSDDYTGYIVAGTGLAIGAGILLGVTIGRKLFCR